MVNRRRLFGIDFDALRMDEAVERILGWCHEPGGAACRYVVTPNVDHAVIFQEREALQAAYAEASLVLVDGTPIVWASRLLQRSLPERVAGSDLVPALFTAAASAHISESAVSRAEPRPSNAARDGLHVFLMGAAPGVAETAANRIHAAWRNVEVVGTDAPPIGFEDDPAESERILRAISDAAPDLLIIGVGAPKQELWVHQHFQRIRAKVAICAGATIDFLAGAKPRSPYWMRRVGLEWLHRVVTEPRRLGSRYAHDAWVFPRLVWHEWRSRPPHGAT